MKQLSYGGNTYWIISETLNYYYVSLEKDGSNQIPLSKMEVAAYNNN